MQHHQVVNVPKKIKPNSEIACDVIAKIDKLIYPYLKAFFKLIKPNVIKSDDEMFQWLEQLLTMHLDISNIMFLLDYHLETVNLFKNASESELDHFLKVFPCTENNKIFFYILSNVKSHSVRDYTEHFLKSFELENRNTARAQISVLLFAATLKGDYEQYCQYYRLFQKFSDNITDEIILHDDTIRRAFLMRNYDFLNHVLNNDDKIKYRYHIFNSKRIDLKNRSSITLWFQIYHYLLLSHPRYNLLEFFSKVEPAQKMIRDILQDENTQYNCIEYTECGITLPWLEQTSKKISHLMKHDELDFNTAYKVFHLDENETFWLSHYHEFLPRLPKVICQLINSYIFGQPIDQTKKMEEAVIKENLTHQMNKYDTYQLIWKTAKDPLTASIHLLEHYLSSAYFTSIGNGFFGRLLTGSCNHHHTTLIKNCLVHFKKVEQLSVQYILNYISAKLKKKVAVNDIDIKGDLMTRLLFIAKKSGATFSLLQEIKGQQKNQSVQITFKNFSH